MPNKTKGVFQKSHFLAWSMKATQNGIKEKTIKSTSTAAKAKKKKKRAVRFTDAIFFIFPVLIVPSK